MSCAGGRFGSESSWRLNVWEIGAWGDFFTLVARFFDIDGIVLAGTPKGFPFYYLLELNPDSDTPYVIFRTRTKPASAPNFPYGNVVRPD